MFGEKSLKLVSDETTYTILERGAQFEGKLTFSGKVQINGKFQGEVFAEGSLVIGEGAEVRGDLQVDSAVIHGRFEGKIRAKSRIEMHPPAHVLGEIRSPSLVISDGALFEGHCSMGQPLAGIVEFPESREI